ncbi:hypothetical protein [uncultured Mesonia sp.]|uniref:hypothetical protein n=1 Tax=uncultured Mesonia sp. TaxID=399731 RepID=UPI00374FC5C9
MENTFKHVTRNLLKIRRSTLKNICKDFGINILFRFKKLDVEQIENITDDDVLEENFVYFLMENKTFIEFYESDYYSDKTIETIDNKIQKYPETVEDYLKKININLKVKHLINISHLML